MSIENLRAGPGMKSTYWEGVRGLADQYQSIALIDPFC